MSNRFPQSNQRGLVRTHTFPEHRVQAREIPEWMQVARGAATPVRFGERLEDTPDPKPEPVVENVRVDPLAEERAKLAEMRRELDAEKSALATERAEVEAKGATLAAAVVEIRAVRDAAAETQTEQLAEIALAVVRAIITDAFSEAPERATALAREALASEESGTLRVGPALHVALLESEAAMDASLDAELEPYGCVFESPSRRVLAGLEDRLAEVLRALKEAT